LEIKGENATVDLQDLVVRTKSISCNVVIGGAPKFVGSGPHHAAPYKT
jgi:hypothetical protein